MKPLIVIPSPRDLDRVKLAIDLLPSDKLWIKYYTEIGAYTLMQKEFLKSDYTHIILIPDDLVVTPDTYDMFIRDLEEFPDDIVSGYCNVDTRALQGYANVSIYPVQRERQGRTYTWLTLAGIHEESRMYRLQTPDKHRTLPEYMIDVTFAGFPLFGIPRKILEKINFVNDSPTGYTTDGCCVDVTFCYDVRAAGYRILCDTRLRTAHLKIDDTAVEKFSTGIKEPYFRYEYAHRPIEL